MRGNNRLISDLEKADLADIRLVCFDADGVTKKRGTWFENEGGGMRLKSYGPTTTMLEKLKKLSQFVHVSISSGRSLSYLQQVYGPMVSENVSLQAEIGMFIDWRHVVEETTQLSFYEIEVMKKVKADLTRLLMDKRVSGFEPKERIITLHCRQEVEEVERILRGYDGENQFDCWWNGEAYDILPKRVDKGFGLIKLTEMMGLNLKQVMTVGNGINDAEMIDKVGLSVSTDEVHLRADFLSPGEEIGGEKLVDRLLELV